MRRRSDRMDRSHLRMPTPRRVGCGATASTVSGATGLSASPSTSLPNVVQQAYQTSAADAILAQAARAPDKKPFVLVYWSRDPDYSQHNADDSTGKLVPGINSTTQHRGITNADNALKALLDTLKRNGLDKDTDIFVTADHGFLTVSRSSATSPSAKLAPGTIADLTPGFVAKDHGGVEIRGVVCCGTLTGEGVWRCTVRF